MHGICTPVLILLLFVHGIAVGQEPGEPEKLDYIIGVEDIDYYPMYVYRNSMLEGYAGELLEHFQWIDQMQSREIVSDPEHMALVREEIADVFSYLLALANSLDIDLSDSFFEKMKRNDQKYPADLYRGKYKL